VETDWREHGVGRALIDAAFSLFRRRGLTEAVIWCLEGNFAGRGFYEYSSQDGCGKNSRYKAVWRITRTTWKR